MNTKEDNTTLNTAEKAPCGQNIPVFKPAADIYETPTGALIRCDMPGVSEQDLEITVENKVLTVRGTQTPQDHGTCSHRSDEYRTGIYQRSFRLGREWDDGSVTASLKDGVLDIQLLKAKEAQPRKIQVNVA